MDDDMLNKILNGMAQRLDEVIKINNDQEARIDDLESKVEELESQVGDLETRFD